MLHVLVCTVRAVRWRAACCAAELVPLWGEMLFLLLLLLRGAFAAASPDSSSSTRSRRPSTVSHSRACVHQSARAVLLRSGFTRGFFRRSSRHCSACHASARRAAASRGSRRIRDSRRTIATRLRARTDPHPVSIRSTTVGTLPLAPHPLPHTRRIAFACCLSRRMKSALLDDTTGPQTPMQYSAHGRTCAEWKSFASSVVSVRGPMRRNPQSARLTESAALFA